MSAAGLLAGLAVLLSLLALRELAATRPRAADAEDGAEDGGGGSTGLRLPRRALAAALRLGLPERIARAGLATRLSLAAVLIAKLAGAALGGLVALAAAPAAPGRTAVVVAVVLPAAGFLVPDAMLERAARRRMRRLLGALPDALDLLAIGSAAGRGPAAGFAEVASGGEGPLAAELRIAAAELGCGCSLAEALAGLRSRVPGAEIASFCAALERSRRLGSPLADQLRRQAAGLRAEQRRRVEERAARAAPKIQLVVALVLVPSVLLIIAAALIANSDLFLSGL